MWCFRIYPKRQEVWNLLESWIITPLAQIIMDFYELKNLHNLRVDCWKRRLKEMDTRQDIFKKRNYKLIKHRLYCEIHDCGCHERILNIP